jgi:hypothetical protein
VKVAVGQQKGGIQMGYNPLKIVSGEILPYAPTYVGTCPADLKFRVRLKVGGKGGVKYRINEGGSTVFQSPSLDFDGGGEFTHDFTFAVPFEGKQSLGQMKQRTFTLHALGKDEKEVVWPVHYQNYGNKGWQYKCIPQVSVGVGGVGPGGANLAPTPAPGGGAPSANVGGARLKAPAAVPGARGFAPANGGTSPAPMTPELKAAPPAPATPPVDGVQNGQTPRPGRFAAAGHPEGARGGSERTQSQPEQRQCRVRISRWKKARSKTTDGMCLARRHGSCASGARTCTHKFDELWDIQQGGSRG